MIRFYCGHCGMKFKVKTQFAGRTTQCPTCKQSFVVPPPSQTETCVAAGELEGSSSNLANAGVQGAVSLEPTTVKVATGQKTVRELLARRSKNNERYIIEQEIARGGMGAVLRAIDCDIRREVAVKYLLDQSDVRKKLRFIEEAQIAGQLEHPNIVPIHELNTDAQKRLFFTMKMVRGKSLAQVLSELREHPKTAEKDYSLGRLLNVLLSICNALAYAHSCGVVHRDLKPANIMLGDFGEVYVMDWGLAKVLHSEGQRSGAAPPSTTPVAGPAATVSIAGKSGVRIGQSSKVVTSREHATDLTQDGAVLGTPVYMPPEQASGNVQAIDQRSDLYSLGAILYELLVLQPPVEKTGSYLEILMRVMKGEIIPPEQRSPQRAKAGRIPPELAAIAMKALAKEPHDRYPNVEALRRDIERFQEGRSVTAKHDSVRELCWKLIKRNQPVSLVASIALVLLIVIWGRSALINHKEEMLHQGRTKLSVPAFVEAAHFALQRKKFDHALVQISLAVEYDHELAEAQLLKGQLLIVLRDFAQAQLELKRYLVLKPNDTSAARLLDLCSKGKPGDAATLAAIAEVFRRQNAIILAASMVQSREQLAVLFRQNINAAWPGFGASLKMDSDGSCSFAPPFTERAKIGSLTPLEGIPLTVLDLRNCGQLKDLTPLQGMALTSLDLGNCSQIKDLMPLQGMPLKSLQLDGMGQLTDLTPLQGMPLRTLSLGNCGQIKDLTPLQGMPLTSLSLWNCSEIKDLAPLQGMKLTTLYLTNCGLLRDLAPLRGMPLTLLNLTNCGQLKDLTPLQGMPLTTLNLWSCGQVKDLSPLLGMPLSSLDLSGCGQVQNMKIVRNLPMTTLALARCGQLRDLTFLEGTAVVRLDLSGNGWLTDLTPLKRLPLASLTLSNCSQLRNLTPLQGTKLETLDITNCGQIDDVTTLQGLPLTRFYLPGCSQLHDLTPLRNMTLREISLTPKNVTKGMEVLRPMRTLGVIGLGTLSERWSAAEFWKRYDAGEFRK